jgi:hypothetical protein
MNKDMRSKLITVAVVLGLSVYSSIVHAEKKAEEIEQENQKASKVERDSAEKPKRNETLKEFTPSEEISIDKPVAFPVDI